MIRVVVDGTIFAARPQGGISRYWCEVLRSLARRQDQVRVAVVAPDTAAPRPELSFLRSGSLRARWSAYMADIFHSTHYTRWPRFKRPTVVTAYDFIDAEFPHLHPNGVGFVERQMGELRRAAAVIAISKATADLAIKRANVNPDRLVVAYPAVSEPFARPLPTGAEREAFRARQTGGSPYLVHVGDRGNYKNFGTLLRAFVLAVDKTDRHLVAVGGASLRPDEAALLSEPGIAGRVHFVASADDAWLRLAYAAADAMVHASRMEGFGIPVIEALACGTGLILSDIPVYREIAEGRALFVAADDVENWAAAISTAVPVRPEWRDAILK
ncbi:MAG: glycosyltransferase family 1 protein, partial [Kiritimatiellae bacterium]|nr:glycosyltransferase family 1 protein [Kiritimatiellia bacterium]